MISAFRFTYGSAQQVYGVEPDLTAMGKIIGGGLAIGAYGGRKDIMEQVAPLGPAYQAEQCQVTRFHGCRNCLLRSTQGRRCL